MHAGSASSYRQPIALPASIAFADAPDCRSAQGAVNTHSTRASAPSRHATPRSRSYLCVVSGSFSRLRLTSQRLSAANGSIAQGRTPFNPG